VAFDAGKVAGLIDLQTNWGAALQKEAAATLAFEKQAQTSFDRASASVATFETQLNTSADAVKAQLADIDRRMEQWGGDKLFAKADDITKGITGIGGASSLTKREMADANTVLAEAIEKYKALGKQVPQNILDLERHTRVAKESANAVKQSGSDTLGTLTKIGGALGIAFGVSQIVGFGKEILNTADHLQKVSDRTSMTTTEVQRLSYIAEQSGNTLDQLTGAAGFLQDAIGSESAGLLGVLRQTGHSFDDLKTRSPYAQMETLAAAIAKVEDPAKRAAFATDAFGRSGREIMPTLLADFKALGDAAPVMSDKAIKSLDATGDAISRLSGQTRAFVAEGLSNLIEWWDYAFGAAQASKVTRLADAMNGNLGTALRGLRDQWDFVRGSPTDAPTLPGERGAAFRGTAAASPSISAFQFDIASKQIDEQLKKQTASADAYAQKLKNIRDQMYGAGVIQAAKDYAAVLGPLTNLSRVNTEEQKRINEAMGDALDAYRLTGRVAPAAMNAIYIATMQVPPVVRGLGDNMKDVGTQVSDFDDHVKGLITNLDIIANKSLAPVFPGLTKGFAGAEIELPILKQIKDFEKHVDRINASALPRLVSGIQRLSGFLPSTFGDVVQGGGQIVGMVGDISKQVDVLGTAGVSTAAKLGASVAMAASFVGVAMTAQTIVKSVLDKIDQHAGIEYEQFLRASGQLTQTNLQLRLAGVNTRELFLGASSKDAQTFEALWNKAQGDISATNAALQRYGLTWRDFSSVTQDFVSTTAADLSHMFDRFVAGGLAADKAIAAMRMDLSQLVVDAVTTGRKLPVTLQPMIEQLIRMGKLSHEAAAALLGIADDGVPALEDIEAAAQRYGLTLDDLGGKVKQLQITRDAMQIVADFKTLEAAGANMGIVMEKQRDRVQALVTAALTMGLQLPASMEPMLQRMIEAGLLTDQFGTKLTSTGQLTFAADLTQKFDELISKLGELIDVFKHVGDEAVTQFERARNAAEVLGYAIPRGSSAPGGGATPSEPTPGGGAVPRDATSNYVASRAGAGTAQFFMDRQKVAEILVPELPGAVERLGVPV
jgi:hypothetical protein